MNKRQTILIADDAASNRSLLTDILSEEYNVIEAQNGLEVIEIFQKGDIDISLILLDIVMPLADGFEVLMHMKRTGLNSDIPVIIISSETSSAYIRKGFEYGACDYINRPFDAEIVLQRVRNSIMLYTKQTQLKNLVFEQVREKEKNSTLMVNVLSTVMEFRNGESGLHVIRIRIITEFLLEAIKVRYPKYGLTSSKIVMMSNAAALHDIGKLNVPEQILNKPARLTPEEFEIIKTHPVIGDKMLDSLRFGKDEELVKYSREICRWHHERWDGRGYPDGLVGDAIPISAQAVALADVYDALVSQRVYKPPYSHDDAVAMIRRGECGAFNPDLMECFLSEADNLKTILEFKSESVNAYSDLSVHSTEIFTNDGTRVSNRAAALLDKERAKLHFIMSNSEECFFEYDVESDVILFSEKFKQVFGLSMMIARFQATQILSDKTVGEDAPNLANKIFSTTPANPVVREIIALGLPDGSSKLHEIILRSIWGEKESGEYISSIIGKVICLEK